MLRVLGFVVIRNKFDDATTDSLHKVRKRETRNVSMGHGCPRYCQIGINRELSLTKGNNS